MKPSTKHFSQLLTTMITAAMLSACGSSSSSDPEPKENVTEKPDATQIQLSLTGIKGVKIEWQPAKGASSYKLWETQDGQSGFKVLIDNIPGQDTQLLIDAPLYQLLNSAYVLQSCNRLGCSDSDSNLISDDLLASIGYFKASNADAGDNFGVSVSLSDDGQVLAVGAVQERSNSQENPEDNSVQLAGAVYVFRRDSNGLWRQEAYLKATSPDAFGAYGDFLALSGDGKTLAIGQTGSSSNSFIDVYVDNNGDWALEKTIDPALPQFYGISLSDDGNVLATSALIPTIHLGEPEPVLEVFKRSGPGAWSQEALFESDQHSDYEESTVSLSDDGRVLAMGVPAAENNSTGTSIKGVTFIYSRDPSTNLWKPTPFVLDIGTYGEAFGSSVSLNQDGSLLAVGASNRAGASAGTGGDGTETTTTTRVGAVYLFSRSGDDWVQQSYLKASNPDGGDTFGTAVSLSDDGLRLAVGARGEQSKAIGLNGDQSDNTFPNENTAAASIGAGAVYLFNYRGGQWHQDAYIKASNTGADDGFGSELSLSGNGRALAVGVSSEDSSAKGINQDDNNDAAPNSGAVYLY